MTPSSNSITLICCVFVAQQVAQQIRNDLKVETQQPFTTFHWIIWLITSPCYVTISYVLRLYLNGVRTGETRRTDNGYINRRLYSEESCLWVTICKFTHIVFSFRTAFRIAQVAQHKH